VVVLRKFVLAAELLQAEEADGVETVEGAPASKKGFETEFGLEAQFHCSIS